MFIAGIDGGGTSTKLEIRTAGNRFVRRESFGAFNISAIGEEGFAARLREVQIGRASCRERVSSPV